MPKMKQYEVYQIMRGTGIEPQFRVNAERVSFEGTMVFFHDKAGTIINAFNLRAGWGVVEA